MNRENRPTNPFKTSVVFCRFWAAPRDLLGRAHFANFPGPALRFGYYVFKESLGPMIREDRPTDLFKTSVVLCRLGAPAWGRQVGR